MKQRRKEERKERKIRKRKKCAYNIFNTLNFPHVSHKNDSFRRPIAGRRKVSQLATKQSSIFRQQISSLQSKTKEETKTKKENCLPIVKHKPTPFPVFHHVAAFGEPTAFFHHTVVWRGYYRSIVDVWGIIIVTIKKTHTFYNMYVYIF